MIYKTFTKEKEKMKHTKEQIEAAIEAVNEEMSFIGHGFTDNQLKTILAALEQYKQPPASNTEALEALERLYTNDMHDRIKNSAIPIIGEQINRDIETIRTALTSPQAKTVDVEALKQEHITETGNTSGLIIFDWLAEKGIINE